MLSSNADSTGKSPSGYFSGASVASNSASNLNDSCGGALSRNASSRSPGSLPIPCGCRVLVKVSGLYWNGIVFTGSPESGSTSTNPPRTGCNASGKLLMAFTSHATPLNDLPGDDTDGSPQGLDDIGTDPLRARCGPGTRRIEPLRHMRVERNRPLCRRERLDEPQHSVRHLVGKEVAAGAVH